MNAPEIVGVVLSLLLTIGTAVAAVYIVHCVLTACEDITAIRKKVCEESNDGTEHERDTLRRVSGIPSVPRG